LVSKEEEYMKFEQRERLNGNSRPSPSHNGHKSVNIIPITKQASHPSESIAMPIAVGVPGRRPDVPEHTNRREEDIISKSCHPYLAQEPLRSSTSEELEEWLNGQPLSTRQFEKHDRVRLKIAGG